MSRSGRPKGTRNPGRGQHDLIIHAVLSSGEPGLRDAPGSVILGGKKAPRFKSVNEAAQWLANEWAANGYHTTSESIRARYNVLKKGRKALEEEEALPEHVKNRV